MNLIVFFSLSGIRTPKCPDRNLENNEQGYVNHPTFLYQSPYKNYNISNLLEPTWVCLWQQVTDPVDLEAPDPGLGQPEE